MGETVLAVSVDEQDAARADALFASLGTSTASAVRLFIARSVREGRIPFETAHEPNPQTRQARDDVAAGRDVRGPFSSGRELLDAALGGGSGA